MGLQAEDALADREVQQGQSTTYIIFYIREVVPTDSYNHVLF